MSFFSEYTKRAKANAAKMTMEDEVVSPAPGSEEEAAAAVTDTPTDETEVPAEDNFAEARNRMNATYHALIRNRSNIVAEDVPEEEPVVEEPVATDDVVETPVEPVEGEVPEEPALAVTSEDVPEETPAVEQPAVSEPVEDEVVSDEDDDVEDADEEIAEVESEENSIDEMEKELNMISQSMIAIESYGINPTAVSIMKTTGLLNGTAIESLGLEAFGYEAPDHPESQMALEALGDKLKEKAAQWSAKIVSMATGFATKTMNVLTPIWNKIVAGVNKLANVSWDAAVAAGNTAKAHPYKTIIGVILAIATAAGIVLFAGQNIPSIAAKQAQVTKFMTDIVGKINGIKWPFGSVKATLAEGATKFTTTIKTAGTAASETAVKSIGWTKSMVSAAGGQLGRAWNTTKQSVTAFGGRTAKIGGTIKDGFTAVKDTVGASSVVVSAKAAKVAGSTKAGVVAGVLWTNAVIQGIISTIVNVTKLVYGIIVTGLRVISSTISGLISGTRVAAA